MTPLYSEVIQQSNMPVIVHHHDDMNVSTVQPYQTACIEENYSMSFGNATPRGEQDINKESVILITQTNDKPSNDVNTAADEFVGVTRKRRNVKALFLNGIDEKVKDDQIKNYLLKRNICPTLINSKLCLLAY